MHDGGAILLIPLLFIDLIVKKIRNSKKFKEALKNISDIISLDIPDLSLFDLNEMIKSIANGEIKGEPQRFIDKDLIHHKLCGYHPPKLYDADVKKVIDMTGKDKHKYQYVAISHRWFDKDKEKEATDEKLNMIHKIYEQFKHLRYFWFDMKCVDQTNRSEVAKSMDQMFKYYENSMMTIVLNVDSDKDDVNEINIYSSIISYMIPFYENDETVIRMISSVTNDILNHMTSNKGIINLKWWGSKWTLQEMILSDKLFIYGKEGSFILLSKLMYSIGKVTLKYGIRYFINTKSNPEKSSFVEACQFYVNFREKHDLGMVLSMGRHREIKDDQLDFLYQLIAYEKGFSDKGEKLLIKIIEESIRKNDFSWLMFFNGKETYLPNTTSATQLYIGDVFIGSPIIRDGDFLYNCYKKELRIKIYDKNRAKRKEMKKKIMGFIEKEWFSRRPFEILNEHDFEYIKWLLLRESNELDFIEKWLLLEYKDAEYVRNLIKLLNGKPNVSLLGDFTRLINPSQFEHVLISHEIPKQILTLYEFVYFVEYNETIIGMCKINKVYPTDFELECKILLSNFKKYNDFSWFQGIIVHDEKKIGNGIFHMDVANKDIYTHRIKLHSDSSVRPTHKGAVSRLSTLFRAHIK